MSGTAALCLLLLLLLLLLALLLHHDLPAEGDERHQLRLWPQPVDQTCSQQCDCVSSSFSFDRQSELPRSSFVLVTHHPAYLSSLTLASVSIWHSGRKLTDQPSTAVRLMI